MTQSDTPVSQIEGKFGGKPSPEGFKAFRTEFLRDKANLKSGNGAILTVATRINTALKGMDYHLEAITDESKYNLYLELVAFADVSTAVFREKYYGKFMKDTPLQTYYDSFNQLWKRVEPIYQNQ